MNATGINLDLGLMPKSGPNALTDKRDIKAVPFFSIFLFLWAPQTQSEQFRIWVMGPNLNPKFFMDFEIFVKSPIHINYFFFKFLWAHLNNPNHSEYQEYHKG